MSLLVVQIEGSVGGCRRELTRRQEAVDAVVIALSSVGVGFA